MVVKKVDETVVARYFYNYDNLIEYIWYPEGVHDDEHPHYVYDGLNRRVKVEYGTVTLDQDDDFSSFGDVDTTKEYVFYGTQPIIEYDNDGQSRTVAKQYYWGTGLPGGIGALLYMKVPGSPDAYYYYHYDGSGNVTCITDADKDIMALYEYDAFGNIITKCGSLANDFLFSTQLSNTNAGWHMYMFRNYDPQLGRWTQRDPIGLAGGLNLYQYCWNNSINFMDILGLSIWDVVMKIWENAETLSKLNENNCEKEKGLRSDYPIREKTIEERLDEFCRNFERDFFLPDPVQVALPFIELAPYVLQDKNNLPMFDEIRDKDGNIIYLKLNNNYRASPYTARIVPWDGLIRSFELYTGYSESLRQWQLEWGRMYPERKGWYGKFFIKYK